MTLRKISVIAIAMCLSFLTYASEKQNLTILHINDFHSQIEPSEKGQGGVSRLKVLIDSVRGAQENVMLVSAGDMVQGSIYFSLFGGEVERKVMNHLDFDIAILGNHEFDNGMEALADNYRDLNATKLTTNYDLRRTPLEGMFKPYTIKEFDGKRIGFIAINIDPKGLIADKNAEGVVYLDAIEAANAMAWYLKNIEHADMVVAVTHIGYANENGVDDLQLARASRDIDLIIGGHSHTTVNPANPNTPTSRVANLNGDTIIVAQTGKSGFNLGVIDIDLATMKPDYRLIPVDKRLDSRVDPEFEKLFAPYRHQVDSIKSIVLGKTSGDLAKESGMLNFLADFVYYRGGQLNGKKVDLSIVNKGGVRTSISRGNITKGMVMQVLPFDNRVVVIDVPGDSLIKAFDVMANRGGDGVSANVKATFSSATGKCTQITIDGRPIDPAKTYRVATIDYLAGGGDYMTSLKSSPILKQGDEILSDGVAEYLLRGPMKGKKIVPDNTPRMTPAR